MPKEGRGTKNYNFCQQGGGLKLPDLGWCYKWTAPNRVKTMEHNLKIKKTEKYLKEGDQKAILNT